MFVPNKNNVFSFYNNFQILFKMGYSLAKEQTSRPILN